MLIAYLSYIIFIYCSLTLNHLKYKKRSLLQFNLYYTKNISLYYIYTQKILFNLEHPQYSVVLLMNFSFSVVAVAVALCFDSFDWCLVSCFSS